MGEILVVANRTVTGQKLLDAMRAHAASGDTTFRFVVPATRPSSGLIIYDDAVRQSAEARVELATEIFKEAGLKATGEVGDPDPFMATMDAVAQGRPQSIIVSTHPSTHSGWQRRDLIDRIRNATGLPVEHVDHRRPAGRPALPRDARGRQQDLDGRGADRAPAGEGGGRQRAPHLHRGGPARGRLGRGDAARARPPRGDARAPPRRRPDRERHDRRPRSLHGRDERRWSCSRWWTTS